MKRYDIAVVGANLGGLATAAILSRAGLSSVVCTGAATMEDATGSDKKGFSFSPGPALSYGYEPGGILQQLYQELGVTLDTPDYAKAYQIVLPDRRITVSPDREELYSELHREFPGEIDKFVRFYQDITKELEGIEKSRVRSFLSERKTAAALIGRFGFSREALTFFNIQSHYFFQRSVTELTFSQLRMFSQHKPYRRYDGYGSLTRRMAEIVLQRGGEIRFNEADPELVFENHRPRAIITSQGTIEANAFLVDTADTRVPAQFFGIRDEVVPVGMLCDVLYGNSYDDPRCYLALSLSAREDDRASPQGMRALTITYHGAHNIQQEGAETLARVADLMPYFANHLVFSEEPNTPEKIVMPSGLSWKQMRTGNREPVVITTARGRLIAFRDTQYAFLEVLSTVRHVVKYLRSMRH